MSESLFKSLFSPVGLIVLVLTLAVAVPTFLQGPADWEKVYIPAAITFRDGGIIYDLSHHDPFVYPPFNFLLPQFSLALPPWLDRVWWWFVTSIAVSVLWCISWRLAGGRFMFRQSRREYLAYFVGAATTVGFLAQVLVTRQTDLLVGAFVLGGLWLVTLGCHWRGGALLGVAVAMKCTPLLFLPYFLWTGRWKVAVMMVTSAALLSLLPDLLFPREGPARIVEWGRKYLPVTSRPNVDPGTWYTDIGFNHSLAGWTTRLATQDLTRIQGYWSHVPKASRPAPETLRLIVTALSLLLVAAGAWVSWMGTRTGEGQVFEFGMILCLMILIAPVASTQQFCILLLPAWAVARYAFTRSNRLLIGFVLVAMVCGLSSNRDLVGKTANTILLWYGALPLTALLLYAGCWWGRFRAGRVPLAEGLAV